MKQQIIFFLKMAMVVAFILSTTKAGAQGNIIPRPVKQLERPGTFTPNEATTFFVEAAISSSPILAQQLELLPFQPKRSTKKSSKNQITLSLDTKLTKTLPADGYELYVGTNSILIKSPSEAGLFYGVQTLRQWMLTDDGVPPSTVKNVMIRDYPRFSWRGLHLDVSRHFLTVEFIKKQIDAMAFYKLNRLHWHLTDGAGWRLQINAYPKLTSEAAWRHGKWKEWWHSGRKYASENEPGAYGGYYTQDEAREIVAYAAERGITVVPEIEMPSHSEEVLAVYPNLSCAGEPYKGGEFCVGNEEVFTFLETVMKEVIQIFPSEYIHIGGDEADKTNWKKCPKCQQRMKENNLKNEDELQSYMIKRMEKFLGDNGRKLIGWDEILEGGLPARATVMSWRGEQGGIDAARQGHDVVMTPGEYCYFDSYQHNPMTEPEAIGGYLPIQKAYSYNPVPKMLTESEAKHILGVQANNWAEYMPTPEHTEYMIYPRLLALSEVAWTPLENKNWTVFKTKIDAHYAWFKTKNINAAPLSTEIESSREVDLVNRVIHLTLFNDVDQSVIHYTTDGTQPMLTSQQYSQPIDINKTTFVKARLFKNDKPIGDTQNFTVDIHKALGKPSTITGINKGYPAAGQMALVDGKVGTHAYADKIWQGYTEPMSATIDLGSVQPLCYIKARFMQLVGPWIWLPSKVKVSVSNDGINYTLVAEETHNIPDDTDRLLFRVMGFEGKTEGRYIKFEAIPYAKHGAVMFTDEVVVY